MLLRTLLRYILLDSMERAEARKCSEHIFLEAERAGAEDKRGGDGGATGRGSRRRWRPQATTSAAKPAAPVSGSGGQRLRRSLRRRTPAAAMAKDGEDGALGSGSRRRRRPR